MAYIQIENVSKSFGSGESKTNVLSGINLDIEKGEFVAILGFSGTGKSTLMNLLAGLEKPDSGRILVDGKEIDGPSSDRGLVFQNYSLLPWLTVGGNVGLAVDQVWGKEKKEQRSDRVDHSLSMVNLSPAKGKRPAELSGGMRQRNSVARTLSMRPEILLLDEPLSALDALTRGNVQDQILEIWEEEKQTIILITNDVDEALYMADRIYPLGLGPGASLGPETEVTLDRPRDKRVMGGNRQVQKMRNEIVSYLLREKEKQQMNQPTREVSLPNIRPMDISMARPTRYWEFNKRKKKETRPKKKKELSKR